MNLIETLKEKTLRLIGLILITIPLMACYPILLYLGLSQQISIIAMVLLSGAAYVLLVTRIEPFLLQMLPFVRPKIENKFSAAKLKGGITSTHVGKSLLYTGAIELDFEPPNTYAVRMYSGNWIHS